MGDAVSAAFTPGPWAVSILTPFIVTTADAGDGMVRNVGFVQRMKRGRSKDDAEAISNARLIAAAPELYDGCNALLGLIQLLLGRDDLTAELREVLTTNHRIDEAQAAVAKAVQQ